MKVWDGQGEGLGRLNEEGVLVVVKSDNQL